MDGANIKEIVKEKYGQAALRGKDGSCCGAADGSGTSCDPITSNLYDAAQKEQIPGKHCRLRWVVETRRHWPS